MAHGHSHPHARAALVPALVLTLAAAFPLHAGILIDLAEKSVPTLAGTSPEEHFGYSTVAGDFDGDGTLELAVGAPGAANAAGGVHAGAVYVFETDTIVGLKDTTGAATEAAAVAVLVITGAPDHSRFGATLASADLDGDGADELVVGAPDADWDGAIAAGTVYVFAGGDLDAWSGPPAETAIYSFHGTGGGGRFGSALLVADVDGDGAHELLVAAYGAGTAETPSAGEIVLVRFGSEDVADGAPDVGPRSEIAIVGGNAGDALRGMAEGDFDGDGTREIAVGAYHSDEPDGERVDSGTVYIVPAERLDGVSQITVPGDDDVRIHGPISFGHFGRSIATGDVDADGKDDLFISAYASRVDEKSIEASGEAFLIFGEDPFETVDLKETEAPRFVSRSRWDLFGLPVLLEDLNADASDDLVVAAQFSGGPDKKRRWCGEVHVFLGSLRSVIEAKAGEPKLADVTVVGPEEDYAIGGSLLVARIAAGSRPDLVIGAPDAPGADPEVPRAGRLYLIPASMLSRRATLPERSPLPIPAY